MFTLYLIISHLELKVRGDFDVSKVLPERVIIWFHDLRENVLNDVAVIQRRIQNSTAFTATSPRMLFKFRNDGYR